MRVGDAALPNSPVGGDGDKDGSGAADGDDDAASVDGRDANLGHFTRTALLLIAVVRQLSHRSAHDPRT